MQTILLITLWLVAGDDGNWSGRWESDFLLFNNIEWTSPEAAVSDSTSYEKIIRRSPSDSKQSNGTGTKVTLFSNQVFPWGAKARKKTDPIPLYENAPEELTWLLHLSPSGKLIDPIERAKGTVIEAQPSWGGFPVITEIGKNSEKAR